MANGLPEEIYGFKIVEADVLDTEPMKIVFGDLGQYKEHIPISVKYIRYPRFEKFRRWFLCRIRHYHTYKIDLEKNILLCQICGKQWKSPDI